MVEMAEIFHRYGPQYRAEYGGGMLPSHWKAMRDIERCRTVELGGHVFTCEACEETIYQYHSCRNRHCPKCQNGKAAQWLEKQQDLLPAAPYFMLTFTLPSELRRVARSHQKLFYHLLFRTSADAVQKLAQDPRFVGGRMGMVGVLHTWGRTQSGLPPARALRGDWWRGGEGWELDTEQGELSAAGEGALQGIPRQVPRRFAQARPRHLCGDSGAGVEKGMGSAQSAGRKRLEHLEVPGALHLSGGHQQQPY